MSERPKPRFDHDPRENQKPTSRLVRPRAHRLFAATAGLAAGMIPMTGVRHEATQDPHEEISQPSQHLQAGDRFIEHAAQDAPQADTALPTDEHVHPDYSQELREASKELVDRLHTVPISPDLIIERSGELSVDARLEYGSIHMRLSAFPEWNSELDHYDLTNDERAEVIERLEDIRVGRYLDEVQSLQIEKDANGLRAHLPDSDYYHEFWPAEDAILGELSLESAGAQGSEVLKYEGDLEQDDAMLQTVVASDIRDSYTMYVRETALKEELGEGGLIEQLIEELPE